MSQTRKWLTSSDTIRFEVADAVASITLNRPDKRNAMSKAMTREISEAMLEADDRKDVNVIVLAGEGRDFCAGYDLVGVYGGDQEGGGPDHDPQAYRSFNATVDDDSWQLERTQTLTNVIFDIHKPVIAKVQGYCLAGGTDIAFMCDLVVAADDARIGFPAARANGTPPTNWWIYHCGPQWAKRMLFTGDTLSGRDAARIGLVLDSAPAAELDTTVAELARRMSNVDAEILSTHKRVVNAQLELMGARTAQRFAAEFDARAHLSQGPRRTEFRTDMKELGLKAALTMRDAPFGDSRIRLHALGDPAVAEG